MAMKTHYFGPRRDGAVDSTGRVFEGDPMANAQAKKNRIGPARGGGRGLLEILEARWLLSGTAPITGTANAHDHAIAGVTTGGPFTADAAHTFAQPGTFNATVSLYE